jgi:dTDP-4-dehydrorhamnose 3,5-epimerase-like enzyme
VTSTSIEAVKIITPGSFCDSRGVLCETYNRKRRPANSRLDNNRLAHIHGVRLSRWQQSLQSCIERLVAKDFRGTAST